MTEWTAKTDIARDWFESLRDRICAEFEAIEREAGSDAAFEYTEWQREEEGNDSPGGGTRGLMKGKVFEKVGVNWSEVHGVLGEKAQRAMAASASWSPSLVAQQTPSWAAETTQSPPRSR